MYFRATWGLRLQDIALVRLAKPVWQGQHVVESIKAQRPLYRYAATGLGASMWFFVSFSSLTGVI